MVVTDSGDDVAGIVGSEHEIVFRVCRSRAIDRGVTVSIAVADSRCPLSFSFHLSTGLAVELAGTIVDVCRRVRP